MHQLSGLDASFLYAETGKTPMHIAQLMIYDPSTAPNGFVRFKDILGVYEQAVKVAPMFRQSLQRVPLNLDHPYWVEDENFDLEFHVRHIALPKPGDWRQLCIQAARLHARPLDLSRPLWEVYVIEGLDNVAGLPKGCFAIYTKVHHACIDGATGVQLINAIHDLTPNPPKSRRHPEPVMEPRLGDIEVLWRAYLANLKSPQRIFKMARGAVPAWRRARNASKEYATHSQSGAPRTRFNGSVSPHRVFGAITDDFETARAIKNTVDGATINDFLMTVVGGAMRSYLKDKGELPSDSLVSGVPVNVRGDDNAVSGNMISMMNMSLRTDIADPLRRLKAVHKEAQASKAYHNAVGATMMTDAASSMPSLFAALGFRAAAATGLMAEMSPTMNTNITNVPGARVPIYMGGAKLVKFLGTGPVVDGLGIIHPVGSYNGEMYIAFVACREMMPDPGFYEQCLRDELEKLAKAAEKASKKPGRAKPKPRTNRSRATSTTKKQAKPKASA